MYFEAYYCGVAVMSPPEPKLVFEASARKKRAPSSGEVLLPDHSVASLRCGHGWLLPISI
jgi:hypothetical protein